MVDINAKVPQKTETRTTICAAVPLLCRAPWTSRFTAALCAMAKKAHQRSWPPPDGWIMKTEHTPWNFIPP